jgi:hypothetical protein
MIPIYYDEPKDWKDLQVRVAKIFSDMGFTTEIEKDITLVRGKVNVDVFATRKIFNTTETQIAECKHWTSAVPKSVVHSVRTILSDYGANTGYIISRKGFQEGAHEAAQSSNLHLFDFDQFQTEFRTQWVNNVVDELEIAGYPLRKYSDTLESFYDNAYDELDEAKQKEFRQLQNKYKYISMKSFRLLYKNAINGQLELDYLDQIVTDNSKDFPKNISVNCLMDYFEYLKKISRAGVAEFDRLFGQSIRKN